MNNLSITDVFMHLSAFLSIVFLIESIAIVVLIKYSNKKYNQASSNINNKNLERIGKNYSGMLIRSFAGFFEFSICWQLLYFNHPLAAFICFLLVQLILKIYCALYPLKTLN